MLLAVWLTERRPAAAPWVWIAPILLLASVIATMVACAKVDPIDFHAYLSGAAALSHPADLYTAAYFDPALNDQVPFVYPPFAAMVFYPLHLMPFWLAELTWRVGVIAALYAVIRMSQNMIGTGNPRIAMLWTAGALWLEPIVGNTKHNTIGVFLMLMVVWAAYTTKWWLSGLLVGLGAGIKLTPAIAGFYLAGQRRWGAAAFSAVVFFATVGISYLVAGEQVRFFFTKFIGRDGLFRIADAYNQSWRGGIARIMGHDGNQALVLAAILGTAVLAVLAWRALDGDQLGRLLVVMLFGLVSSPVSWTNHWVWVVPLLLWLFNKARALWWAWLAVALLAVPNALATLQPNSWDASRPWYLAWAGLVYELLTVATLAWISCSGTQRQNATEDGDTADLLAA